MALPLLQEMRAMAKKVANMKEKRLAESEERSSKRRSNREVRGRHGGRQKVGYSILRSKNIWTPGK